MINWQETFYQNTKNAEFASEGSIHTLKALKSFLDAIHIRYCLVKPYQESSSYPLVELRELLPSFDNPMFEYKNLPSFSMVVFERELKYFDEQFQYDILYPIVASENLCPLEEQVFSKNMQTFLARLPRMHHDVFRSQFPKKEDFCLLENYPLLLPYLLNMDRGHVLSLSASQEFYLSGIYASFTNDIDTVLKRFGQQIGKFRPGDNELYAYNRLFVYQFLMELYGFPIASERRTSAAMFARRLCRRGENFLIRVLGQTDRTITTYTSDPLWHPFPKIEKIALVAIDKRQEETISLIDKEGFFLDRENRIVILRVTYRQHRYNENNIRKDRALSVVLQEIIHPITGDVISDINVIRDASNMYLRLNDIVRGEYTGKIFYKKSELIEDTKSDKNRLKALHYWISKNQRKIIDYSDEFFEKINKVLSTYLTDFSRHEETFQQNRVLYREVCGQISYILQARRIRILEEITSRIYKGKKITYRKLIQISIDIVKSLRFEIANFLPEIIQKIIACINTILSDKYLLKHYIQHIEGKSLTPAGEEIKKGYGILVSYLDEFRQIQKTKKS